MATRRLNLPEVEVIEVGVHRGERYTLSDLRDMVRNFRLCKPVLDPPVVIGHEERQPLLAGIVPNTGEPAVGWVDDLWVENRQDRTGRRRWALMAALAEMHPVIARLVRAKAYRKVSPEVYTDGEPPEGVPPGVRGMILRRLSMLGGDLPQIKTLADLPAASFSERRWRVRRAVRLRRHAEGEGMDRAQMTEILLNAGWTQEEIDAIKDDAILGLIVAHEMKAATGGGAAPPAGMADAPMPGVAGLPDRATMTADLVAAGHDQAELDALDDAALAQMWADEVGTEAMSETKPAPQAARAVPAVPTPTTPAVPAGPNLTVAQFGEAVMRLVLPQVRRETAAARRDAALARRDDRLRRVEQFAEEMRGFVPDVFTPSDWDAKSTAHNLYGQLRAAAVKPRVVRLGEKDVDELDALIAGHRLRVRGRTPRRFAERLADPQGGERRGLYDRIREDAKKRHEVRDAARGRSLEERLHMTPPRGGR